MMCKIKSCAGLHLFKAAILCSPRNYLDDIDTPPPMPEDWRWCGAGWARGLGVVRQSVAAEGRLRVAAFTGSPRRGTKRPHPFPGLDWQQPGNMRRVCQFLGNLLLPPVLVPSLL